MSGLIPLVPPVSISPSGLCSLSMYMFTLSMVFQEEVLHKIFKLLVHIYKNWLYKRIVSVEEIRNSRMFPNQLTYLVNFFVMRILPCVAVHSPVNVGFPYLFRPLTTLENCWTSLSAFILISGFLVCLSHEIKACKTILLSMLSYSSSSYSQKKCGLVRRVVNHLPL